MDNTVIEEGELREVFEAKCEDFGIKFTEKLFQRFVHNQSLKSFSKILDMKSCCLGPKSAVVLANLISKYANLKIIDFSENAIGDQGVISLSPAIHRSKNIISLNLSSNSISGPGAQSLFAALRSNRTLVSLSIGSSSGMNRNTLGQAALELSILLSANKILSELDISMSELTSDSMEVISRGLSANKTLQVLNLSNNNIQSRGASCVITALAESQIKDVNLSGNHIKDDLSPAISLFLQNNKTISMLNLSGNCLTGRFAQTVSFSSSKSLKELDLSKNPICNPGASAIGDSVAKSSSIAFLNISACKIDGAGFEDFCSKIEANSSLEVLIVSRNPLKDSGCRNLPSLVKNHPKLREICLELCEIDDEGAKLIFEGLADAKSIEKIDINNNLIRNGLPIQKAVSANQSIQAINIEYNDIDLKVYNAVAAAIKANQQKKEEEQNLKTQEDAEALKITEKALEKTRNKIVEERLTVTDLEKAAVEIEKRLGDTIQQKDKKIADSQAKNEDTSRMLSEFQMESQKAGVKDQDTLEQDRVEVQNLIVRFERAKETYRVECKAYGNLEERIEEAKRGFEEEIKKINQQKQETIVRYKDIVRDFKVAFDLSKDKKTEGDGKKSVKKKQSRKKK